MAMFASTPEEFKSVSWQSKRAKTKNRIFHRTCTKEPRAVYTRHNIVYLL